MNESNQIKSTSSWKYIGVWILWLILSGILGATVGFIYMLIAPEPESISETVTYDCILYFILFASSAVAFVKVYERFQDIKIKKVMVYLWILKNR